MHQHLARHTFLTGLVAGGLSVITAPAGANTASNGIEERIAQLENRHGGRLGVAIYNSSTRHRIGHRADERFAMCSTFKFLAAAYVLVRVDEQQENLERRIMYKVRDLVEHSPISELHVGSRGMTVGELCKAMITYSDNTAANLILQTFGGPPALTAFIRAQRDPITRLDRTETGLNENAACDPRDTTSPHAMLQHMQHILLGTVLSPSSRDLIIAWLCGNTTGAARLEAGLPTYWRIGDKTGSGSRGAANDIAIVWPPHRHPLLVATYYSESLANDRQRNAVLADVGKIVATL